MAKTREQKLFGAAVLKTSFRLRDSLESPAFKGIYPGVLRDLGVDDAEVEKFIEANREAVEKAAKGQP
ncbi:MAG: hypothetical protein U0228_13990 [Myxococcaceae bacterium]